MNKLIKKIYRQTISIILSNRRADTRPTDPLDAPNNLTLIRWLLALAVLIGHGWRTLGTPEPLGIYNWLISDMAVIGFFILSGLLITKSLSHNRNIAYFIRARFLRIFPALFMIMLITTFVIGPIFTTTSLVQYFGNFETYMYGIRTLTFQDTYIPIPALFNNHPDPVLNVPLWTIRYEVLCYALCALAILSGVVKNRASALILLACLSLLNIATAIEIIPSFFDTIIRFATAFSLGMVLFYWPRLRSPGWLGVIGSLAIFFFLGQTMFSELSLNIFLAAAIMHFGLNQWQYNFLHKIPDYSYGIYIWHFIIYQCIYTLYPEGTALQSILINLPLTLLLAGMSWHLLEKPMLKFKQSSSPKLTDPASRPSLQN